MAGAVYSSTWNKEGNSFKEAKAHGVDLKSGLAVGGLTTYSLITFSERHPAELS